jgi:hypothetical protein
MFRLGPCFGGTRALVPLSSLDLDHAAADLVELDALEQGLEVAVAEALVALALDDLEEDRAEQVLGEDLQQQALLADIAVEQDAVLAQALQVLAVAGTRLSTSS